MSQPFLSIGMPVWNGERFLSQTIESFLAQDYENYELIILDNISTDRTAEICKSYVQKDARVKYILDSSRKDVMQGHKEVAKIAEGEFFMGACDDDWYAPEYISTLMRLIEAKPSVGLAYSGMGLIYPDDTRKPFRLKRYLTADNSEFFNFAYYLLSRTPFPLGFGIIRTELHRDALNYFYLPDHRGWDHDNLYMLRLLSMARVDSTTAVLFYYRQQDRDVLYKTRGQYNMPNGVFERYINNVLHQISMTREVIKIINVSSFNTMKKHILKVFNLFVLLYYCGPRYLWSGTVGKVLRRILKGKLDA